MRGALNLALGGSLLAPGREMAGERGVPRNENALPPDLYGGSAFSEIQAPWGYASSFAASAAFRLAAPRTAPSRVGPGERRPVRLNSWPLLNKSS